MKAFLPFIFVLLSLSLNAQNPVVYTTEQYNNLTPIEKAAHRLKVDQYTLKKAGVSVKIPSSYTRIERDLPMYCNSSYMSYGLVNRDSSILIGIGIFGRDSLGYIKETAIIKRISPELVNYDPDNEWLATFRAQVDSTNFKPIFYSQAKLKKYNADGGVEFSKTCNELLLDEYKVERKVVLNKRYRGIIEITYFIRQNAKVDITKLVKNSSKIIFYN